MQAQKAIEDAKTMGKQEAEKRLADEKAKRDEEKTKREEEKRQQADEAKKRKDEEKQKQDESAKARPAAPASSSVSAADIDKGLSQYKSGRREDAMLTLLELARSGNPAVTDRAKRIVSDMKAFNENYDNAARAISAKEAVKAIGALKEAMRLDLSIAAGSTFAGELKTKMADMFTLIGNQEKQKDQFDNAQKAYTKALQFVPGHAAAKAGLDSLGDAAKRLYYEGFAAKDKNPALAKSKWQQVMKVAAPGSDWYKKASAELEDME